MLAGGGAATRPTYQDAGFRGKACLRFDGVAMFMLEQTGLAPVLSGVDKPFTVYVVGNLRQLSAIETFVSGESTGSANQFWTTIARASDTKMLWANRQDGSAGVFPECGAATATLGDWILEASFDGVTATWNQIFQDGTVIPGNVTGSLAIGQKTLDTYVFGASFLGGVAQNFGHVSIADHLIYNKGLSAASRAFIRGQLIRYWFGL